MKKLLFLLSSILFFLPSIVLAVPTTVPNGGTGTGFLTSGQAVVGNGTAPVTSSTFVSSLTGSNSSLTLSGSTGAITQSVNASFNQNWQTEQSFISGVSGGLDVGNCHFLQQSGGTVRIASCNLTVDNTITGSGSGLTNIPASQLSGVVDTANGGLGTGTWNDQSIPYYNASALRFAQDASSLSYDYTNHRLGVGTAAPLSKLDVNGGVAIGSYAATNAAPSNGLIVSATTGIGSSTPWGLLSVNANGITAGTPQFVVGSSTATNFIVANSGKVGIGTTLPTNSLSFSGQSTQTISLERQTTSNTAGNILELKAGGATSGATNKAGGNTNIYSGISTGSGGSDVNIYTSGNSSGGATADDTNYLRASFYGNKRAGVVNFEVWDSNGASLLQLNGGSGNLYLSMDGTIVDQIIGGVAYYGSGSSGTYLGSNGLPVGIGINPNSTIANLFIQTPSTSEKDVIIRGIASQTASLQEWQDSGSNVLGVMSSNGNFGVGTSTPYATSSIQSNASTGDAFVVATSSKNAVFGIDNDGHQFTSGPAPAITSCGTGTGTVVGDDQSGTITTATAATACTATFSKAYRNTPVCTVTDDSLVGFADVSAISTTAVTFGISSALTGGHLYFSCSYHR